MIKPKSTLFFILIFCFSLSVAQDFKFGKVSKQELEEKYYPSDSSANAAYLYKKRRSFTTILGGIKLITEVQVRLKIYNKDGFKWATEEISLFGVNNSDKESVTNVKAITYNLDGEKITETKLDKKSIFQEEKSKNWRVKKFTMPNLKVGSVVEWSYKIISPYFTHIDDIIVQYEIPVKKYETKINLLDWFYFNKRQKGYYPFRINESTKRNHSLKTNDKVIEITIDDVPAIKEEPYINNIKNYTATLQLEVASLSAPRLGLYENYATSWEEIAKDIYKNSSFGGEIKKTGHLKEDIANLKSNYPSLNEKIIGAFQLIKNKIKWNENKGKYPEIGLRKAYDEGTGNVADINLTLVALLKEIGVKANPVLVSTRSHGIPLFPTNRGFNYVIASVETNKGVMLLDATEYYSLPNILPLRTLNWQGRIVREDGSSTSVNLFPNKPSTKKVMTKVKIDSDGIISGLSRTSYEGLIALNYRKSNNKLNEDELIEKLEKNNQNIEIDEVSITNKEKISKPIVQNIQFESDGHGEVIGDKIYFSPLLYLAATENPFKLEKREFPVDFGAPWQNKITISIDLPEGYKVESKPENAAFALPENLGFYKFAVIDKGNSLQVLSEVQIKAPIISSTYYNSLKEFYKMMIDKQLEKVVLTKQ